MKRRSGWGYSNVLDLVDIGLAWSRVESWYESAELALEHELVVMVAV